LPLADQGGPTRVWFAGEPADPAGSEPDRAVLCIGGSQVRHRTLTARPPRALICVMPLFALASPDSLASSASNPNREAWARFWPVLWDVLKIGFGALLAYFLTRRNERMKAKEKREDDQRVRDEIDRRELQRREEDSRKEATQDRRRDYRVRHSLAIEVSAFLDRWELLLNTHTPGMSDPDTLNRLEQDAEAFRALAAILADIRSDVDRGIAMQWCMLVRTAAHAITTIRTNPAEPRQGEGQVPAPMQAARNALRLRALGQLQQLLEAGRRLRPWINIYDAGEKGGLVPLPDAPPPTPDSTTGQPPAADKRPG